jgi:pilus assembly protein CpaC
MHRIGLGWLAAALCAVALLGAGTARADDPSYNSTYEVVVGQGKSQVLQLPEPYSEMMIADPKVADVLPLTTHSVYIVGKSTGATALTLYGPGKRLLAAVNVVVSADIESFKARLHDVMPEERDVVVRPANQSIVLSGTASSPAAMNKIMELAETYDPAHVVNMMTVEGVQQVMLSVRFVEMARTTAKALGVEISSDALNTSPLNAAGTPRVAVNTNNTLGSTFGQAVGTLGFNYRWGPNTDISVVIDALENKGLTKTLAEPNLTTMSGDTANFLAGGEFPIPVAQSGGVTTTSGAGQTTTSAITIEFKQFGIALGFTPTVLQDGLINMVVNPEVSALDRTIEVNGVPGLKTRRAHATVELRDGESFTIAGLLADDYTSNVNAIPYAADIPILGTLFRSQGFQHDQTELVIVVTPHLVTPRKGYVATPTDHFVPPSDFELFLLGQQDGEASNIRPEDRVLLEADPTKGGVEGPHGHVLY